MAFSGVPCGAFSVCIEIGACLLRPGARLRRVAGAEGLPEETGLPPVAHEGRPQRHLVLPRIPQLYPPLKERRLTAWNHASFWRCSRGAESTASVPLPSGAHRKRLRGHRQSGVHGQACLGGRSVGSAAGKPCLRPCLKAVWGRRASALSSRRLFRRQGGLDRGPSRRGREAPGLRSRP